VLWISQAFSLVGSAVVEFALAWYLTKETGSAVVLGTALTVALLPQIVLGPFIGPLVDRWDRKTVMICSDLAVMLITVWLVVLFLMGSAEVWHIYAAMAGRAIGQAFQFPAMQATVATIVPEKHLSRAAGLNMTLNGIINIAAPPLGAVLLETLPMQGVLSVDIITAIIAVGCLGFMAIPRPVRTTLTERLNIVGDMLQSLRVIMSSFGLKIMVLMVSLYCFFATPAYNLMPMLVNRQLGGDVLKLGWMNSTFGVGMILGGLTLGVWGGFKRRILTSASGSTLQGILLICLGFTTENIYVLVIIWSFFLGVGVSLASAPISAIINAVVEKDMQGRVFSMMNSIASAMIPLGLLLSGRLADRYSISLIYFVAGGVLLCVMPLGLLSRTQRDL